MRWARSSRRHPRLPTAERRARVRLEPDLMYPFVDGTLLANLMLDVGRDDYYGAAGVGFDVRTSPGYVISTRRPLIWR